MNTSGLFITFEGMDGSGKTTQMHRLAARLRTLGRIVLETAEPGGPPIATKIRRILLDSANRELSPTTEILLYFASRAAKCRPVDSPRARPWRNRPLRPLYRFLPGLSGRRPQSRRRYRRRVRPHRLPGPSPHLTILVDVDAEASLARARARNAAAPHCETRLDDEALEFHQKVWEAYHALAVAEPNRVKLVDGRADLDTIEAAIWEIVQSYV